MEAREEKREEEKVEQEEVERQEPQEETEDIEAEITSVAEKIAAAVREHLGLDAEEAEPREEATEEEEKVEEEQPKTEATEEAEEVEAQEKKSPFEVASVALDEAVARLRQAGRVIPRIVDAGEKKKVAKELAELVGLAQALLAAIGYPYGYPYGYGYGYGYKRPKETKAEEAEEKASEMEKKFEAALRELTDRLSKLEEIVTAPRKVEAETKEEKPKEKKEASFLDTDPRKLATEALNSDDPVKQDELKAKAIAAFLLGLREEEKPEGQEASE